MANHLICKPKLLVDSDNCSRGTIDVNIAYDVRDCYLDPMLQYTRIVTVSPCQIVTNIPTSELSTLCLALYLGIYILWRCSYDLTLVTSKDSKFDQKISSKTTPSVFNNAYAHQGKCTCEKQNMFLKDDYLPLPFSQFGLLHVLGIFCSADPTHLIWVFTRCGLYLWGGEGFLEILVVMGNHNATSWPLSS